MTAGSLSVDILSIGNVSLQKMNQMSLRVKSGLTQRALDWRVRAAFSGVFSAQASSVKMALSHPSRQQVTHTVRRLLRYGERELISNQQARKIIGLSSRHS